MDKNIITVTFQSFKERFMNNPLFSKAIPMVLSVFILSLTAYYCIKTPWLSLFDSAHPDTKQLIAETFKFNWVPVFLSCLPYVFYALILNFIALLMGNRILRWLKVDFDSNIDRIVFSVPLGWSIYSIGIFYLGVFGLLYVEAVYCFLTFLGILSILEIKRFFRECKTLSTPSRFKIDKTDLIFLPVIIIFITIQLITSFSPVWSIDALMYHMALPKLYIKHSALVHIPGFFYSTLPAHTEMLYLLGLITSGETLSKLFSFSISSVFLLSIFSIGNKYFSKGAGYLAVVALVLIFPYFSVFFTEPYVDTVLGLLSLLGIYAFFIWIEDLSSNEVKERREGKGREGKGREGYLYLSIICCALAAATKLHGLFFVLLFFVGFLVIVKKDRHFMKKLIWCFLAVSIIALPWYIRSWWLTGDPVFPVLYKYLGARYWNEYSNVSFWEFIFMFGSGAKSFSDFIRINKDFLFLKFGIFSLFIVIFLIPTLIMLRNRLIMYLFFTTLVYYIFFIFTSPHSRYFCLGIASICIIGAYFIKAVWTKYPLTKIPIILCIVAFSIVFFFKSVGQMEGPFFAGLGILKQGQFHTVQKRTWDNYIDHHYEASIWINKNLPQNSKILTWYWLGYHLERNYLHVNPAFQGVLDFSVINDAHTFLKSIKELGITHLMYLSTAGFHGRTKEFLDKYVAKLLENGKITQLKQIGPFIIYSVGVDG